MCVLGGVSVSGCQANRDLEEEEGSHQQPTGGDAAEKSALCTEPGLSGMSVGYNY